MYTEKQRKEFEKLTNELIKFICENGNPHTKIIIDCDSAELVSGEISNINKSFILD